MPVDVERTALIGCSLATSTNYSDAHNANPTRNRNQTANQTAQTMTM